MICQHCQREIALATLGTDLEGRQVFVWHYVDPNASYPTPRIECPGSGHAPPPDIYRSNTGAADLIPNKITRRFWIGCPRRCGRTVMREHINGQTTGKHSEGDES